MLVTADAGRLLVRVDDSVLEGWLVETPCPTCGGPVVYDLAYDATCCPACNAWLELRCPDPECWHCRCRPARPWSPRPGASPAG
jgi:hypothetical protein